MFGGRGQRCDSSGVKDGRNGDGLEGKAFECCSLLAIQFGC